MVKEEVIRLIWELEKIEVTVCYKGKIIANYYMGVTRVEDELDQITVYGEGIESIVLEGKIEYDDELESYLFDNGDLVTYIAA